MLAALAIAGAALGAAPPRATALLSVPTMQRLVGELASDRFEGRAPGTVGEDRTMELLVREYKRIGLRPGNHGSWFQEVPLADVEVGNVRAEFSGARQTVRLEQGGGILLGTERTTNGPVALDKSPVIFAGYGISAPERGWDDYAGSDVAGKTVVVLANEPDYRNADFSGPFRGKELTYYGRPSYKFEEAARRGAAAVLIVHQDPAALSSWESLRERWTRVRKVAGPSSTTSSLPLAIGWLGSDQAKAVLAAGSAAAFDDLVASAGRAGFRAIDLGSNFSARFDARVRTYTSRNLVALLPGKQAPGEYVVYTAHWDHLGRCAAAADGDDICNGARDNATGTAALVAIAEAQSRAGQTRRSQLFISFTAEESGLLGSQYYASHPAVPLAATVGGINIDTLSSAGLAHNVMVVGAGKSELDAYLDRALARQRRVATPLTMPDRGLYYRSDHFSLARVGVPMLCFVSGDDLVAGGVAAGRKADAEYSRQRYHQPADELDPSWDWSGIAADAGLSFLVGRELAQSKLWPNWNSNDEFRAIRDRSRAGSGTVAEQR